MMMMTDRQMDRREEGGGGGGYNYSWVLGLACSWFCYLLLFIFSFWREHGSDDLRVNLFVFMLFED